MGQSPKSEHYNTAGEGLPFLQGNRTFGDKYPAFDTFTTMITKTAEPNDVIMSVRAPVGDLNITPLKMCLGRGLCALRHKQGEQEFLYYFMRYCVGELINRESGTVFGSVNRNDIKNLDVDLPDLATQREIAATLRAFDEKIAVNTKLNHHLEQMAQAIFKSWFVDFEPWGGTIPAGWNEASLESFITYQEGPGIRNWQYVLKSGIKFINIRCIQNGDLQLDTANMVSTEEAKGKYNHFLLDEWDIVVSTSGTLGRYAIVRKEHLPLCLNTSVIRFSPKHSFEHFSYVFSYLTSAEFLDHLQTKASGSVQANFGPMHLRQINMLIPSEGVLNNYHKIVFPLMQAAVENRRKSQQLANLRDTILPRLMSGGIRSSPPLLAENQKKR
jgi:type I restriction enzyme S subunit